MADILDTFANSDLFQPESVVDKLKNSDSDFDYFSSCDNVWFKVNLVKFNVDDINSELKHFEYSRKRLSYLLNGNIIVNKYSINYEIIKDKNLLTHLICFDLLDGSLLLLMKFFNLMIKILRENYNKSKDMLNIDVIQNGSNSVMTHILPSEFIDDVSDLKNLLQRKNFESFSEIFKTYKSFSSCSEMHYAQLRIKKLDIFKELKKNDINIIEYEYQLALNKRNEAQKTLSVDVKGRTWLEMLAKSLFIKTAVQLSSCYNTSGELWSIFKDNAFLSNNICWFKPFSPSVLGPIHFFKSCIECLRNKDKSYENYDYDALALSVEDSVRELFIYHKEIINKNMAAEQAIKDILQKIIDDFPMEKIIDNMVRHKKRLSIAIAVELSKE